MPKACYVGAPAIFKLELACKTINDAYGGFGCYLVGSAIQKADWRDVDVRLILSDEDFQRRFPDVQGLLAAVWEHDSLWLLTTVSITAWLRDQTGLPVDFQIQPQTFANAWHKGQRYALGLRMAKRNDVVGRE